MSLSYTSFVTTLANTLAIDANGADFQAILPNIIDYAEQRIYRELDPIAAVGSLVALTATTTRALVLTAGTFRTITAVNVINPVIEGGTVVPGGVNPDGSPILTLDPSSATRTSLTPVSRAYIDAAWPSRVGAALPQFYAMANDHAIIFGPWPDKNYTVEVIGVYPQIPLSAANGTTWLTLNVPDLFFAAAMVFATGWTKNWGAQADDPKMAMSWESQYGALLSSAKAEEARRRFMAPSTEN